jgi:hypothetical protein
MGGGGPATISIRTLRAAAEHSQTADTQTFEFSADISAKGHELTMKGSGIMAGDGKTGKLTMTVPSVGDMHEIITADGIYMELGGAALPDGKKWLFIGYADIAGRTGVDLQQLQDQQGETSSQVLGYLRATTGDVEKVGDDTVAGAPATHYVTHVDYGKFSEEHMPAAQRAKIAKLGVVPVDVWINGDDRVVKMAYDVDASATGGQGSKMRMTMEITGFGEPLRRAGPAGRRGVQRVGDLDRSTTA